MPTDTAAARRWLVTATLLAAACTSIEDRGAMVAETPPAVGDSAPPAADPDATLRWVRANACTDQSPMSLTASDGTGLALQSLKARATVEGPIALTELTLSFDNPEDRVLEGRFAITLPPRAAISRFAMKIDGRWQEGEVVERQAARRAYEDFLHRRQDPALLESDAGNVFRARVFPIPARGRKEIVLSYSQALPAEGEPWRLPLCGLPTLGELDVDVAIVRGATVSDATAATSLGGKATAVQHLSIHERDVAPTKDLEAWVGHDRAQGIRHGDLAIARIKLDLAESEAARPIEALTILLDTSASRALDFEGQLARLQQLITDINARNPELALKVLAFDQDVDKVFDGPAIAFGDDSLRALRRRGAMGASDLAAALRAVAAAEMVSERLLLIGDGVATAGATEAAGILEALRQAEAAGVRRTDVLVDGGLQDAALLEALVRRGNSTDGVVLDARMDAGAVVERLHKPTRSGVRVQVPGADWSSPTTLDGVQPGDEVLIYAQLPPETPLTVVLDDADKSSARGLPAVSATNPTPALEHVPGPLLARAHAQARIDALDRQLSQLGGDTPAPERQRLREEIVALSTRHRVLSDFTALLVLETEADYERFGIERNALSDILTVGPAGVEVLQRQPFAAPDPLDVVAPDVEVVDEEPEPELEAEKAEADKDGVKEEEVRRRSNADAWRARGGKGGGGRDDGDLDLPPVDGRTADSLVPAASPQAPEPDPAVPAPRPSRVSGASGRAAGRITRRPPGEAPHPSVADRVTYRSAPPAKATPKPDNALDGRLAAIMALVKAGDHDGALRDAKAWRAEQPGDVLALIALGEVYEAKGAPTDAARAYGSLIDLFPSRADLRRMAGERLERLGRAALPLVIDTYQKAVASRPDQPSGARLLAYAQLKAGEHRAAFETLQAALDRRYPSGRFAEVRRILTEDLGLVGQAWIAADPKAEATVVAALRKHGGALPTTPSTRFVLTWETDANDVDLHIYDARGNHAYYGHKHLASGGELYADVTTGYGPECFTVPGKAKAGPYRLQAHYYRRGPMGYGMGKLQVVVHDGRGGLTFQDQPFVILRDDAYADLAVVPR